MGLIQFARFCLLDKRRAISYEQHRAALIMEAESTALNTRCIALLDLAGGHSDHTATAGLAPLQLTTATQMHSGN